MHLVRLRRFKRLWQGKAIMRNAGPLRGSHSYSKNSRIFSKLGWTKLDFSSKSTIILFLICRRGAFSFLIGSFYIDIERLANPIEEKPLKKKKTITINNPGFSIVSKLTPLMLKFGSSTNILIYQT